MNLSSVSLSEKIKMYVNSYKKQGKKLILIHISPEANKELNKAYFEDGIGDKYMTYLAGVPVRIDSSLRGAAAVLSYIDNKNAGLAAYDMLNENSPVPDQVAHDNTTEAPK